MEKNRSSLPYVCAASWTARFEWHCVSFCALAVFSRNALYKSTFYLLTYLRRDVLCLTETWIPADAPDVIKLEVALRQATRSYTVIAASVLIVVEEEWRSSTAIPSRPRQSTLVTTPSLSRCLWYGCTTTLPQVYNCYKVIQENLLPYWLLLRTDLFVPSHFCTTFTKFDTCCWRYVATCGKKICIGAHLRSRS